MSKAIRKNPKLAAKMRKKKRKRKIARCRLILVVIVLVIIAKFWRSSANLGEDKIEENNITNKLQTETITPQASNSKDISVSKKESDWNLILVNSSNPIPDKFTVKLKKLKNGYQVDERICSDLEEMFDAARNKGIYPDISSAYRTSDEQQSLYNDKVKEYLGQGLKNVEAERSARTWVALPGTSEHQIGLALDINAENDKCTSDQVYLWLNKNSYKYGFIMRYPPDKSEITGTSYEPWHYRYVGKVAAKALYEKGICLEEYLATLK